MREALRGLGLAGLLEPRVGDGTYVRAVDEITGVLVRDDLVNALEHVLDARAGLEAASARLAAQQATPEALTRLSDVMEARTRAHDSGNVDAYVQADAQFHRAVVEASGNPLLIRLYAAVSAVLHESITDTAALPEDPQVGTAHQRLMLAIRDSAPEDAARIAYELIESVKATIPRR